MNQPSTNAIFQISGHWDEYQSENPKIATLLDVKVETKAEASALTICIIGYKSLLLIGLDIFDNCKVLVLRCLTMVLKCLTILKCVTIVSRCSTIVLKCLT